MSDSKRLQKRFRREPRHRDQSSTTVDPDQFVFKEGRPMAILRPSDLGKKLAGLAKIPTGTPHEIAKPMLDQLLEEQPHQFVGYATKSGKIVNCAGKVISSLQPGDSFIGVDPDNQLLQLPDFMTTGVHHLEIWDGRTVVVLPRPNLKVDSNTGIIVSPSDASERGAIMLRGGQIEIDCHIPTLNRIITGDPNIDYRTVDKKETIQ